MTLFYCPSTSGFYDTDFAYYPNLPKDVIKLTREKYAELMSAQLAGNSIQLVNGLPTVVARSVTPPAPSKAQQAATLQSKGLTITSPSIPLQKVAFPSDSASLSKYNTLQTYLMANNSFPDNSPQGPIKDSAGNWHMVTVAQYKSIVSAIAQFVSAIDLVVDEFPNAVFPNNTADIA